MAQQGPRTLRIATCNGTVSKAMVNQAFQNAGIEIVSLQGTVKVTITGGQDRELHILNGAFEVSSIREIEYTGPYNAYGGHIGLRAFNACQDLTRATISCVTKIYAQAFARCSRLEEAQFKDVHSIYPTAFLECHNLRRVMGSSVTTIGEQAFADCSRLVYIESLPLVEKIERGAFRGCESLTNVELDNVVNLGAFAFSGCTSLRSVDSLDKVQFIRSSTFKNCQRLTRIDLRGSHTLRQIQQNAFEDSGVREVLLPPYKEGSENFLQISKDAFAKCAHLHSLVLTDKVYHLGERFAPQTRSIELHCHSNLTFHNDAFVFSCADRLLVVYGIPLPKGYVLPEKLSLVTVTFTGHVLEVACSGPDPLEGNPGIEPLATYIANEIVKLTVIKKELPQDVIKLFDSTGNVQTAERVVFKCATKARNGWLANAVRDKVDAFFEKDRLQQEARFTATFADLAVVS